MDLDELRSVQSKERSKDSLQHLRDSFYEDVAAYLGERKRQRDERAASVDQPFSDDQVRKLSNEIETAEEVVESLYERRVGKVVKLASFAAAGAPTDTEGMTAQEAELFEDLVVRIEQNKSRVLDVLESGADVDLAGDAADELAADPSTEAAATAVPAGDPAASTPEVGEPSTAEAAPPERGAEVDATTDARDAVDGSPSDAADAADGSGVLADAMGGDGATASDTTSESTTDARSSAVADAGPTGPGDGESHAGSASDPDDPSGEFVPGSEPDRAGATGTDSAPNGETEPSGGDTDRQTVRITRDVGQILGVDEREYELANDDVVSLPTENADPLLKRDAAEPIE
ncbi:hypothetical protein [Halobaculum rubrum]|uniref:hypothetical protein n=1 Tax=Halobaculum rubrum TaxID=2872158 RepID=UPI001CA3FDA3|nr:hypothetical protein [Halobaculum rubrum]QZX99465.1 hypothetical protein K6T25_14680 [Halobaculum rubrum]